MRCGRSARATIRPSRSATTPLLLDEPMSIPRTSSLTAEASHGAVAYGAVEYVNLGNTGLRVSRLCLGMMSFGRHEEREWALEEEDARPIVRAAIDGGVTFFDTADVYNGGE